MKEVVFLSSKSYKDENCNYGDCILINTGSELVIYDCGSEEHADFVIDYMDKNGYDSAKLILSHNDADHFDGIPKLIESEKLSLIRTTLLLKYKDEILDLIDDKRKTRDSVSEQILEIYSNISKLSGFPLEDVYESTYSLASGITIVGPEKDYMLETVAKRLDGREGNTVDGETAVNATSLQVCVKFDAFKLLLCGDCSYVSIEDKVRDYQIVQLPHHGKPKQANLIFDKKSDLIDHVYVVSDNTGGTNGGSDDLDTQGYIVKNTKLAGNVIINDSTAKGTSVRTGRTLGVIECDI